MKRLHVLPALMLGFTVSSLAFAEDTVSSEAKSKTVVEKDADGTYHKKTTRSAENTDAAGTETKSEVKAEVKTDAEGNGERKIVTKTSTDPEGLMNKSKTEETSSVKYKDGEVKKKYQKKVDGKTVEEHTATTAN
jgi:hypothetical protein